MRKFIAILLVALTFLSIPSLLIAQFNQFTFLKGNTTDFSIGSYGTQGVASVSNNPGKRRFQTTWQYNGKIYLFGGEGNASNSGNPPPGGYLNDLWEYDPSVNNWRWLKGSNTLFGGAVYGTKGVSATTNTPGARKNAMGWVLNNKFYLFGGYSGGRLCDLWEYDPATNNWTWISGNNSSNSLGVFGVMGVSDAANLPAGREQAATWAYNDKLYIFGGIRSNGVDDVILNDQWEYDLLTGWWRWIKGSNLTNQLGVYGSMGVSLASNIPGSRYESGYTTIGNKTYLWGGAGYASSGQGVLGDLWEYDNNTSNWTWLNGSSGTDALKVTGTQGIYSSANTPGGRGSVIMTTQNNSVYLYGGFTHFLPGGFHSDLWQYDPSLNQWRSVKGSAGTGTLGTYGFQLVESSTSLPPARGQNSLVTIGTNIYLFGGRGYSGISSASHESQNDLWRFNTTNNNWTWLKGSSGKQYNGVYGTQGIASETNKPGGRTAPGSIGANDKFYLFGGNGLASNGYGGNLNDLWEYNPLTNSWSWLKGSNAGSFNVNYGTIGVPSITNLPPGRQSHMLWNIGNKIYMFGGTVLDYFNDLWEYDLTTNNWTWLKGSNVVNQSGNYGTKGVAAATNTPGARWLSATFTYNNKIYLHGGNGYNSGATRGELNDLWEYDPATNNWTWLSGNDAINSLGIYGTIAVPSATNLPGARESGQMQVINNKAYLFGGRGFAVSGGFSNLNDMWEYDPASNNWTWIKGPNTGSNGGVAGSYGTENAANNPSARYYETSWTLNNKFYVFSGTPFGPEYNDVWEYNPATNNWRYIAGKGNIGGTPGNYGLQGIANRLNLPTQRWQSTAAAAGGNAYIFGGLGAYANNTSATSNQSLGDLWKWAPGPDGVFTYGSDHKIYVNDNNLAGDTYTTAVGNNLNTGNPSDPLATVDFAVSVAMPGDVIYVDAGTYVTPNFTIGKAITILGTNYTISPNNPSDKLLANPIRNAEAIISGATITIGSSNISVEGLTFDPGNKSAFVLSNTSLTNNDFGNFGFLKNILRINSTSTQFTLVGKFVTSPAMPITSGYSFTDNRFEKYDAGFGQTMQLSYLRNININNNSFVVSGATPRTQLTAYLGITGLVDNVTFTNNIVDKSWYNLFSARVANVTISNNKFYNSQFGIQLNNSINESSNIEILDNLIECNSVGSGQINYSRSNGSLITGSSILKVENNTININAIGNASQILEVMNLLFNNTVLNPSLIVRGNRITHSGDVALVANGPRGISLRGKLANVIVENNELLFNAINVIPQTVSSTSSLVFPGIVLYTDVSTGAYVPSDAVINIQNNKIQGYRQSIAFYDVSATAPNTYVGYGNLPSGATVNINNNSFTNDEISINNGTTSQTVNANCNWYGVTSAQAVLNKITPTTVNYSPWLTNGTDSDISTVGFQPLPGVCNGTPVTVSLDAFTNVTCNGVNNGTISVTVSGGLATYTFVWTKDEEIGFSSFDEDPTNLSPGTYQLLLTDANGSIASLNNIIITEPALLTSSASGTNVLCFGDLAGTATVTADGGTVPYTYLWSNGETTSSISNLAAGNYSVTVTDANGCTSLSNYEVTQPPLLSASATGISTTCANSATVTANGGTGTYTYLWSNGATTQTINSLLAGTYSVTVADANSCTTSANCTVTSTEAYNSSAQVTDVSCYGGSNGSITVTNANGVAPFQYNIDGLNFQNSNVFNNLSAGTYTITVVDFNGCTGFVTKTISQPPLLTVISNSVQSTCFGISTGSITVTASGGSGALSYSWTGPNGFTSTQRNINNLATGNYSLTVTDNNGCTANLPVLIPSFNEITVTSVVTNIACKGETNGAINLTVSGGTGSGFTYNWSNSATTEDIETLGVANYNVTITDNVSGCFVTRSYSITQPASIVNLSTSKTNATGCNSLGTITATGSGGTPGYQYSINGINYQIPNLFTGLYTGSYTVWVKDANGCTKTAVVTITDNGSDENENNNGKNQSKLIIIGTPISARIATGGDVADWFKFTTGSAGSYVLTFTHPQNIFTYNMYAAGNNTPALTPASTTSNSKTYTLAASTTYYISVTGGLSYVCYQLSVSFSSPLITSTKKAEADLKTEQPAAEKLNASVFPNPHRGIFNLVIDSPEEGNAVIQMIAADGKMIVNRNVTLRKGKGNIVEFNNMQQNILFYRIIMNNKTVTGKIIGPN